MTVRSCCQSSSKSNPRRTAGATSWILPGAALLLFPKCPACIVAYLALATGLSMSVSAVARLRIATVILSAIPATLALVSFFSSRTHKWYTARLRSQRKVATATVQSWFRPATRPGGRIC